MKHKGTYPGWLSTAFKTVLGLLFFGYIYQELASDETLGLRLHELGLRFRSPARYWLLLAVALMPLNLGLESYKWRRLLRGRISLPPATGLKAVYAGMTVSLLTPNRIGEFAGRILFLPSRSRIAGIFATFIGSFAQVIMHWLTVSVVLLFTTVTLPLPELGHWLVRIALPLLAILWLLIYFKAEALVHRVRTLKFGGNWQRYLLLSGRYTRGQLRLVLLLAALRYLIFTHQLYFLMLFVGFPPDAGKAVTLIPMLFLVQTLVPSFLLTDLGVRGGLALLFFEPWAGSAILALLPTYLLWCINIILPAVIGWFSIVRMRGLLLRRRN